MRKYTNRIIELLNEGYYTSLIILEELLQWLPENTIKDFYKTAFGNTGLNPTGEQ